MDKEPEKEGEESFEIEFRSENGGTYSGNKIPDDTLCRVCEKKFSEHTVEMHKACARKQRELLFGTRMKKKRTKITIWIVFALAMGIYYVLVPYGFPWPKWWGYGMHRIVQPYVAK